MDISGEIIDRGYRESGVHIRFYRHLGKSEYIVKV